MTNAIIEPPPPPKKLLRILCLHGYKQNGSLFKSKTAVLRKSMKDIAEFIYVDAPHMIDQSKDWTSWWRASKDGREYRGFDQTLEYLRGIFEQQGPFDGVMGFSQGAVLAGLICSLSSLNNEPIHNFSSLNGGNHDDIMFNDNDNDNSALVDMYTKATTENSCFNIKFAMLFSGFQSRAIVHQSYYPSSLLTAATSASAGNGNSANCDCTDSSSSPPSPPSSLSLTSLSLSTSTSSTSSIINACTTIYPLSKITTPSIHVWGKADELCCATNCESLSHHFSHPQCYVHEFGHLIPTNKSDINVYRNFLSKFSKDSSAI